MLITVIGYQRIRHWSRLRWHAVYINFCENQSSDSKVQLRRHRCGCVCTHACACVHTSMQTHTHTLKSLFLHVTWSILSVQNKWCKIQTRNIKHKYHPSNVEAWKVVSAAITILSPVTVDLLLQNPPLFLCMEPYILKTFCICHK